MIRYLIKLVYLRAYIFVVTVLVIEIVINNLQEQQKYKLGQIHTETTYPTVRLACYANFATVGLNKLLPKQWAFQEI